MQIEGRQNMVSTYIYCLPSDWVVFVNTCQKGREIDEVW